MINCYYTKRHTIREAMKEIGFTEEARYFTHPETDYLVEFPPGPLTVGEESVKQIHEIKYSTGILRVISPTDCVKDRLAAFYHWGDMQSLTQAIMVAQRNDIDMGEIDRWSAVEGKQDKFMMIKAKLMKE